MRKHKTAIILVLVLIICLATMVNAQALSPRPARLPTPTVPLFMAPAFTPIGIPAIACDTSKPVKLTLSAAEQVALRNLEVGKWVVVNFNFPCSFNGQRLVWTSSNPKVAIADGQGNWGLVLGVGPGTTTITVSTTNGTFKYSFQVVVR